MHGFGRIVSRVSRGLFNLEYRHFRTFLGGPIPFWLSNEEGSKGAGRLIVRPLEEASVGGAACGGGGAGAVGAGVGVKPPFSCNFNFK